MEEIDTRSAGDMAAEMPEAHRAAEAETDGVPVSPDRAGSAETVSAEELLAADTPAPPAVPAEDQWLRAVLEAIVYVTEEPLSLAQIAAALDLPAERIRSVLERLMAEYESPEHGLAIREVAGGYKMATKPEHHEAVRNFVKNLKPPLKLSLAALETLAVIAYKQPVTAPEIMEIRGVQGTGVLKTLLDRKLIAAAGRKNVIGKPILYKTTRDFLVQFGLRDLSELPTLKEFEEIRRMAIGDAEEQLPLSAEPHGDGEPEAAVLDSGEAGISGLQPGGEPAEQESTQPDIVGPQAGGQLAEQAIAPETGPRAGGHSAEQAVEPDTRSPQAGGESPQAGGQPAEQEAIEPQGAGDAEATVLVSGEPETTGLQAGGQPAEQEAIAQETGSQAGDQLAEQEDVEPRAEGEPAEQEATEAQADHEAEATVLDSGELETTGPQAGDQPAEQEATEAQADHEAEATVLDSGEAAAAGPLEAVPEPAGGDTEAPEAAGEQPGVS